MDLTAINTISSRAYVPRTVKDITSCGVIVYHAGFEELNDNTLYRVAEIDRKKNYLVR